MRLFIVILLSVIPAVGHATDIRVENAYYNNNTQLDEANPHVVFTVSWDNAWRNSKNHDAAWVFMKFVRDGGGFGHIYVNPESVEVLSDNGVDADVRVPEDKTGMFVFPSTSHRGSVKWRIRVGVDSLTFQRFNTRNAKLLVSAIEMVYVPEGRFTLGDPDTAALEFASFFRSDSDGNPAGLFEVTDGDSEIRIGSGEGWLNYRSSEPQYQGDMRGVIPSSFPNGFDAFYIMKYETSQGQYAQFLNTLSPSQTHMRVPFGGKGYYENRGTIKFAKGVYIAESPGRPANYITWDDGAALADWAGLRPMTELEFTKAARGPGTPLPHEYPWNTTTKHQLSRFVNTEGDLVMAEGLDESQLSDQNRDLFGASYYWVMDLAGSVWEKCVTVGDEKGRSFTGSHGDGMLTGYGSATNDDWPEGIDEQGGYGYRGGGYYHANQANHELNPHSPIAYRTYASWSGGTRSIAYSNRYVRTAPED